MTLSDLPDHLDTFLFNFLSLCSDFITPYVTFTKILNNVMLNLFNLQPNLIIFLHVNHVIASHHLSLGMLSPNQSPPPSLMTYFPVTSLLCTGCISIYTKKHLVLIMWSLLPVQFLTFF